MHIRRSAFKVRPRVGYGALTNILACIEDFAKYNYTVKENVNTGNYRRRDDTELLEDALKKGGADEVVRRLPKGLDEILNKDWIPPQEELVDVKTPETPAAPPAPNVSKTLSVETSGIAPGLRKGAFTAIPDGAVVQSPMSITPSGGSERKPSNSVPIRSDAGPARSKSAHTVVNGVPIVRRGKRVGMKQMMAARDAKPLSGGQWQRLALSRAFMRSEEADLVVFESVVGSIARFEEQCY